MAMDATVLYSAIGHQSGVSAAPAAVRRFIM
jgi:hypothetical protein